MAPSIGSLLRGIAVCAFVVILYSAAAHRVCEPPRRTLWFDELWRACFIADTHTLGDVIVYGNATHGTQMVQLSEWVLGKAGMLVLGRNERALRIWPVLFGVLGAWAAFWALPRPCPLWARVLTAFLVALGPGFVYHAREFKPYALDIALTLGTVALAGRPDDARRKWLLLPIVLLIFSLSSLTFVFVWPACVVYALLQQRRWSLRQRVLRLGSLALPGAAFAIYYVSYLRPQLSSFGPASHYWASNFVGLRPSDWVRLVGGLREDLGFFVLGRPWWLVALVFLVLTPALGCIFRDPFPVLVTAPLLFNVAASAIHAYPLFARTGQYLFALSAVSIAYSSVCLARLLTSRPAVREGLLMLLTGGVLATYAFSPQRAEWERRIREWPPRGHGEGIIATLADHFRAGDAIYSSPVADALFSFYRPEMVAKNAAWNSAAPWPLAVLSTQDAAANEQCLRGDGNARCWIVVARNVDAYAYEYADAYMDYGPLSPQGCDVYIPVAGRHETALLFTPRDEGGRPAERWSPRSGWRVC